MFLNVSCTENKKIRGKKHRKDVKELIQCFKEHGYTLFPNQEILRNVNYLREFLRSSNCFFIHAWAIISRSLSSITV